jgi:hypothetical protein
MESAARHNPERLEEIDVSLQWMSLKII